MKLRQRGIERIKVPGDGNCAYSSVSYFIHAGDISRQAELRREVHAFLIREAAAFEEHATGVLETDEDWHSYCGRHSKDYVWAEEPQLFALASVSKHRVVVISPSAPDIHFTPMLGGTCTEWPTITLAYDGLHYDPCAQADIA